MLYTDLVLCFLGNFIMANAQTCYYPDGSIPPRDTPCHSPSIGDGASACCAESDICLDNGLCLANSGSELISRGSCTDQSWQSPECSQYCNDGKYFFEKALSFFNSQLYSSLILALILILQSTRPARPFYSSFTISTINGCSAVARVTNPTTHA